MDGWPRSSFNKKGNFVVILLSSVQSNILKKIGNDIILVDDTHRTGYDFTLYTILILDEMYQEFPVASMMADWKDT